MKRLEFHARIDRVAGANVAQQARNALRGMNMLTVQRGRREQPYTPREMALIAWVSFGGSMFESYAERAQFAALNPGIVAALERGFSTGSPVRVEWRQGHGDITRALELPAGCMGVLTAEQVLA